MGKMVDRDCFSVRKCANCGKEMVVPASVVERGAFVMFVNHQKKYCCGWKCFRQFKYGVLMKKKSLTLEDKNWLKYARFE